MAEQTEPTLPRLLVDDATAEKLGMMLAEQGGRIASMSPEGSVFDLMAGLYSKSGIPQFGVYLIGHSGDDLITDRVSRKSVRVERPALTCAYAMQPAIIEGLAKNAAFRGRGLLARFLYAAPRSWLGRRQIAPTPVSDATRAAYRQTVRALAKVEGEFVLQLAADAETLFREWEAERGPSAVSAIESVAQCPVWRRVAIVRISSALMVSTVFLTKSRRELAIRF